MFSFDHKPRMQQLRNVIQRGDKYYFVSTNDTPDHGFETMVFPFDLYEGKVTNWGELYADHYETIEEAAKGHALVVANFNPD